jgi:peroxiredoxin
MMAFRFVAWVFAAFVATSTLAVGGDQSVAGPTRIPTETLPSRAAPPPDARHTATPGGATILQPQPMHLPGLDGAQHSLADWQGKVIVLNFWAAWCAPCQAEIRVFVDYQRQYANRGLQIVGVGIDAERQLRNVQRTLEINYPVLVADPAHHGGLMQTWGNSSGVIPYTVVIDRNGRVAYTRRGPVDRDDLDEHILPLLD